MAGMHLWSNFTNSTIVSHMTSRSIMWFRRDLRLADNPALLEAIKSADEIVPIFIVEDKVD
jgi:deoxyribodipyrimidine photolyase